MECRLCPRNCAADRINGEKGFCLMPYNPVVARASLHMWEEPCISGTKGSGTIFFSGCSLKCVYCQNFEISHENFGEEINENKLIDIIKKLCDDGAHNINFVNPTHFSHIIFNVLEKFRPPVPVVFNCSGYEKVSTLKMFEGLVDIYLTDLKYFDSDVSKKYSDADDYFKYASEAVIEMKRQKPEDVFDKNALMTSGVIIRHLVLPNNLSQTEKILSWIKNNLPDDTMVSLMSQYVPYGKALEFKELNRKLTQREYDKALDYLYFSEIENGFVQELDSSDKMFIPPFNLEGVK